MAWGIILNNKYANARGIKNKKGGTEGKHKYRFYSSLSVEFNIKSIKQYRPCNCVLTIYTHTVLHHILPSI